MGAAATGDREPVGLEQRVGIAAGLAAMAAGLFNAGLLDDGDVYWHVATGGWIADRLRVPLTDPFSYTFAGVPWHAHEWLADVLMGLAYRADGLAGVLALYGFAIGAAVLILAAYLRRWLTVPCLLIAIGLVIGCARPTLLARPHLLVMPLTILWGASLLRAREAGRAPHLAWALVMVAWANLHGSFVFGFVMLGGLGLEALVEAAPERRFAIVRDWGLFGLASLAAAACNPEGVAGLIFPFELMGMTSLSVIDEWRPTDFSTIGPFEISLLVVLFLALSRGVRVRPVRLLLVLGLLHMALQHSRHAMIAAAFSALMLAEPFSRTMERMPVRTGPGAPKWFLGAAALAAAALLALRLAIPVSLGDSQYTPRTALNHVPPEILGQPVLNDYSFGGYLIFRRAHPFIDGRTDLYGDAFMRRYLKIAGGDPAAIDGALRRYPPAWTIFSPASAAAAQMDHEPGWRRLYADRVAVIHVRAPATGH
jgi:hypothetical protein